MSTEPNVNTSYPTLPDDGVQPRWKSPVAWATAILQVVCLLEYLGVWAQIGIPHNTLTTVVTVILNIGVIFGIWNNPTNKTGF